MIGIAGAGGIGSNVAVNLIRSGVKKLKIVDFDRIEQSNLNRQFYFQDQIGRYKVEALKENLQRINPEAQIITLNTKIEEHNINDIFDDCDIIVEGFDKAQYKALLIEYFIETKSLIVSASGIADHDLEEIKVKKIKDNCYIIGDFKKDIKDFKTYSTKVSIVAAMMANIVLEKTQW
ncbi:MAG: sulfur carrier protein ThiS adenylyltransferase ThiF [Sulfurospirillaceae bacterium]|nr:sulfur carrier protein ThiS adenylyltransferase ThiF [Sulfurospirillaceae bacterium]